MTVTLDLPLRVQQAYLIAAQAQGLQVEDLMRDTLVAAQPGNQVVSPNPDDPRAKGTESIDIQNTQQSGFGNGFFEARSIDQLIGEQNVRPITDLLRFSGAFPDDDIDEMLAENYSDRAL